MSVFRHILPCALMVALALSSPALADERERSLESPSPEAASEGNSTGEWTPSLREPALTYVLRSQDSSYVLRISPQLLPLEHRVRALQEQHQSTGSGCHTPPFHLSLSFLDDVRRPLLELMAANDAVTFSVALQAFASEEPFEESPTPDLRLPLPEREDGNGAPLNAAFQSVARSRREGNLYVLEFGIREGSEPAIILVGGEDSSRGGYVGQFIVPGITRASGNVSFQDGFHITHRQDFVAYTLPLNNGGSVTILPSQSFHLSAMERGALASTSPELGVAIVVPVPHYGPLNFEVMAGPDVVLRTDSRDMVRVLPTFSTSVTWNY